jgi:hypothetical protein
MGMSFLLVSLGDRAVIRRCRFPYTNAHTENLSFFPLLFCFSVDG